MKAVQIGGAGHAFYAYQGIKDYGIEFTAIASGSAGAAAEGTAGTQAGLVKRGFSVKLYEDWRVMLDTEKPDIVIKINTSKAGNRYVNFDLADD
jgi:hypothetical protein